MPGDGKIGETTADKARPPLPDAILAPQDGSPPQETDTTPLSKGGRPPGPGITPGRPIKGSGKARAEGQRVVAFNAKPADWLVSAMNGMAMPETDAQGKLMGYAEPLSMDKRADIAKFLVNKLVGNAAPHHAEETQGKLAGDWIKLLEGE